MAKRSLITSFIPVITQKAALDLGKRVLATFQEKTFVFSYRQKHHLDNVHLEAKTLQEAVKSAKAGGLIQIECFD